MRRSLACLVACITRIQIVTFLSCSRRFGLGANFGRYEAFGGREVPGDYAGEGHARSH